MQKQPRLMAVFFLTWMVAQGAAGADKRPVPVAPGGPSGETAVSRPCPTFHWSVSMARRAAGYELAVYRVGGDETEGGSASTAEPVLYHRLPAGAAGWTLPPDRCLEPGGRYAWSVRAVGKGAEGKWSEPALFEISAVPSLVEVEEALEVLRRFERSNERSWTGVGGEGAVVAVAAPTGSVEKPSVSGEFPELRRRPEDGADSSSPTSAALEAAQVGTNAAPSASSSPSLSVDGQIHLGSAGDVFRDGVPFLWTDGMASSANASVALGLRALESSSGSSNTAVGHTALAANTTGSFNSAFGEDALFSNTTGSLNSAFGEDALRANTTGSRNSAFGEDALSYNTTGGANSAFGENALLFNTTGSFNSAFGRNTLLNTSSSLNSAFGDDALRSNTTGSANTAVGEDALFSNTTGSNNIAIGRLAGASLAVTASNNILIGNNGSGVVSGTPEIRIGLQGTQVETRIAGIFGASLSGSNVVVDSNGQLGVSASSRRFKEDVRDMGEVSDKLSKLRPVRFRFKAEDADSGERPLEYGLIAEEVAEVLPELVPLDAEGKPYAVRYDLLSSLLLSELQRQRRDIEALEQKLAAERPRSRGRWARKR